MPEFVGRSDSLNLQAALEEAVRKAYDTAYEGAGPDDHPLVTFVVKRLAGERGGPDNHRTVTVVIEATFDAAGRRSDTAPPTRAERPAETAPARASAAPAERGTASGDPIKVLLEKHRRNEPLTPNEQALIELLAKDDTR